MRPFGVFGGMFDPIHYGHLRTAHELHELLGLEAVAFVPAGDPPHRTAPLADAATRLEMVRAAVGDDPRFQVDDRELRRAGPSYTILTLEELRAERGAQPIVLILGMDAFAGIERWHRAGGARRARPHRGCPEAGGQSAPGRARRGAPEGTAVRGSRTPRGLARRPRPREREHAARPVLERRARGHCRRPRPALLDARGGA